MHWSNGKVHGNLTVGDTLYISDYKYTAIYGQYGKIYFANQDQDTVLYGNNTDIITLNRFRADSEYGGSYLRSKKNVRIESGAITLDEPPDDIGAGMRLISNNGPLYIESTGDGFAVHIKSDKSAVDIDAGTYINLMADSGIKIGARSYGTSLPNYGQEGQIFFKVIS